MTIFVAVKPIAGHLASPVLTTHAVKEIVFIRQNIKEWQRIELMTDDLLTETPDDISAAYIRVTSDLAFAQTHYPASRITLYLNNLAVVLHNAIYRNKRERRLRIVSYWTREVPLTLYHARKLLLVSLVIFLVSVLIGVVGQLADHDYCRVILGDSYVDMTLDNISKGRPFDVYSQAPGSDMFVSITTNNIYVSFLEFVMGVFTSICTGFMLFNNGVMLGSFEMLFAQHGLFMDSLLTVFLHGTLEISALVVAGAAGICMGNGWLFPGTYSRIASFRRSAKRGLKIVVGTVPMFIVAGFIEGFLTGDKALPDLLRLVIVVLSAAFVVFYYILYPRQVYRQSQNTTNYINR